MKPYYETGHETFKIKMKRTKVYTNSQGSVSGKELEVMRIRDNTSRPRLKPIDWRHQDSDLLKALGKDIFIHNLKACEICSKYGIHRTTVQKFVNRLKPKGLQKVHVGRNKWEWRKRESMKLKLELNLENKAWSASELIMALSRTVHKLDGTPGSGKVTDKEGKEIGSWEVDIKGD